jgi:hypothetical protein
MSASIGAITGGLMKRIFIGVLVLTGLSMAGCNKEIKEAVKPTPAVVPVHT